MNLERPDLTNVAPHIRDYIEALESALAQARKPGKPRRQSVAPEAPAEPTEPPTTMNMIAISNNGYAKRTARHLYTRQSRGGMGIFDLDTPETDPPNILTCADEAQSLLFFSDQGRSYRMELAQLAAAAVRTKGQAIPPLLDLSDDTQFVAALPADAGDYVALASQRGWVNIVRRSFVSKNMIQGVSYYKAHDHGPLAHACWLNEGDDIFIATQNGLAIRFPMARVPKSGCLGIRLERDDNVIAVAAANESNSIFLLSSEGKGIRRLMTGFRANKSPGGGGKVALKTDLLVGAVAVNEPDDIFIISKNNKIIRFKADSVPAKTGTVQGVNCIALRGDRAVAVTIAHF